ncbi:MAG: hypothetical protein ABSB86_11375 [Bryobacteraceae bacterium]
MSFVLHRLKIARRPATRRPLLRYNPGMTKHRWCIAASRAVLLAASIQFAFTEPLDTQKLVLENQFVRVFEIRVPPGVFEPRHSHARGVTIALSDYSNEVTNYPDGKVAHGQVKFGDVRWAEPVTHEARNTGITEQHVIRIELKQPAPAGSSAPPADLDSLLVCKDTLKLIFENQFVRVIDDRIPAGVAEPKHEHPHGLTIALADSDSEAVTYPGGETARRHASLGDVHWTEAVVHEVRNVGTTDSHTIRIELK